MYASKDLWGATVVVAVLALVIGWIIALTPMDSNDGVEPYTAPTVAMAGDQ